MELVIPKERTNHHVYRHAEGRSELDKPDCEATYLDNWTIPDEQQDREIDVARLGAIRLTAEEAKEAIMEELHLELHDMVSSRTKTDRNFRISVVRANDPDHPLVRPGFKFFVRHQGYS
eukprot:12838270-Heterocapsa_arctica.AAC.1